MGGVTRFALGAFNPSYTLTLGWGAEIDRFNDGQIGANNIEFSTGLKTGLKRNSGRRKLAESINFYFISKRKVVDALGLEPRTR